MLNNTLNTNEIKSAAGAGIAFQRLVTEGRSTVFAKVGESPSYQHRLSINHTEIGEGLKRRRRSNIRVDKMSLSTVDNETPVTASVYTVIDAPVGAITAMTEVTEVLANLMSFLATTGAGTTVLFDGSGNGAKALLEGSL